MLHPSQMTLNTWLDPIPFQPLEEAHPNHLPWLSLSARNFVNEPLDEGQTWSVTPIPTVGISHKAGEELECTFRTDGGLDAF